MFRRIIMGLAPLAAVFAIAVTPSVSNAYTISQAGRAAYNYQAAQCGSGWDWFCNNADVNWPDCYNTGANRSGVPQYECSNGDFCEENVITQKMKMGDVQLGVDPYGTILSPNITWYEDFC